MRREDGEGDREGGSGIMRREMERNEGIIELCCGMRDR